MRRGRGTVSDLRVAGHILATGAAANAVEARAGGRMPLANVRACAEAGETLLNTSGTITDQTDFAQK
ncbi:hypothetical protein [Hymenobacter bucti]|uniref:FAD/NAD(P)-binding domain-containing protein n=1 Tax=Hymenobacter bucti TaxID=1844114 RepID=A0ABW4R142_9BACT